MKRVVKAIVAMEASLHPSLERLCTECIQGLSNRSIRDALDASELDAELLWSEVLSILLRCIVLEDALQSGRYPETSVRSLRSLLVRQKTSTLWEGLFSITEECLLWTQKLQTSGGVGGASFLWDSTRSTPWLSRCSVSDAVLSSFIKQVRSCVQDARVSEILWGSVLERLLSRHMYICPTTRAATLQTASGHQRKITGSYYTPDVLIHAMLDCSFEPLIEETLQRNDSIEALRALRICDPSCGSGFFLLAVVQRLTHCIITHTSRSLSKQQVQEILNGVIEHCVYGVDIQPLAVELCIFHLWQKTDWSVREWGRLYAHIRVGNSICGTTRQAASTLFTKEALKPIVGDDPEVAKRWKKIHRKQVDSAPIHWREAPGQSQECTQFELFPSKVEDVQSKQEALWVWSVADIWCSSFVWPKTDEAPALSHSNVHAWMHMPQTLSGSVESTLRDIREQFAWFHWELAFPELFSVQMDAGQRGFDLIIGNPPWERMKLQEREWFSSRKPAIASAKRASERRSMIADLQEQQPHLFSAYIRAKRRQEGMRHFARHSGLYPLSSGGDVNLYTLFVEKSRALISKTGRIGLIVPSGIATDHTSRAFFQDMMSSQALDGLFDFENTPGFFPDVSSRMRFSLLSLKGTGVQTKRPPSFLFFAHSPEEMRTPERQFSLTEQDLRLLNPNTQTCPIFRSNRDAEITLAVYRRFPVLEDESKEARHAPRFIRMFDMTNHSSLFHAHTALMKAGGVREGYALRVAQEEYLPLYEGKMYDAFDHRCADVETTDNVARPGQPVLLSSEEHASPTRFVQPQFWVRKVDVDTMCQWSQGRSWFLTFKDVTSPTNSRTCISTILPYLAVANSSPILHLPHASARELACVCGYLNSFALDYIARQKISSLHLNFFIVKQLPFPDFSEYMQPSPWCPSMNLLDWIAVRVVQLVCTSMDVLSFAEDCAVEGAPFKWDVEQRWTMRCELDAAFFWLFGCSIEDVEYILDTFPVIRKRELAAWGNYRTKERIVELLSKVVVS